MPLEHSRSVTVALTAGLALLAIAIGLVLTRSPASVALSNGVSSKQQLVSLENGSADYCQAGESLPAGVSAVRLSLEAFTGPAVKVNVLAGEARSYSAPRAPRGRARWSRSR
jgi:hypothetical protein